MLNRPPQRVLLLVLLAAGLFYACTIREGHDWTGDFAQYLQHAQHLAAGEPYALSGIAMSRLVVPPPYPAAYPPVYPAVLAPLMALRGPDLELFKLVNVLFFIPALYLVARLFQRRLRPMSLIAVIALTALNPHCWAMKDVVLSDIMFIFFVYAALLAVRTSAEAGKGTPWARFGFLAAGLLSYLAFATRTAGIVILPAAILLDLLRTRRIRMANILATLVVAVPVTVAQLVLLPGGAGYLTWIGEADWRVYLFSLMLRLRSFAGLWGAENPTPVTLGLAALAGLALLFLYARRLLRGADLIDIFFALYLLVLLVYPGGTLRYLVPVLPVMLLYLFEGIDAIQGKAWLRPAFRCLLVLTLLFAYATGYGRKNLTTIPHGVTSPEARGLFQHIRERTPPDAVILCHKPRVIHFYTGRTAAPYYRPFEDWFRRLEISRRRHTGQTSDLTDADFGWRFELIREVGAEYLLQSDHSSYDRTILVAMLERYPERFTLLHTTTHFRLYRIERIE